MNFSIKEIIRFLKEYASDIGSSLNDYYSKEPVSVPMNGSLLDITRENKSDIIIKLYTKNIDVKVDDILSISFLNPNKKMIGDNKVNIVRDDNTTIPAYVLDNQGTFDKYNQLVGYSDGKSFRDLINSKSTVSEKLQYFLYNVDDFFQGTWKA